jgi:hypothetical protein
MHSVVAMCAATAWDERSGRGDVVLVCNWTREYGSYTHDRAVLEMVGRSDEGPVCLLAELLINIGRDHGPGMTSTKIKPSPVESRAR